MSLVPPSEQRETVRHRVDPFQGPDLASLIFPSASRNISQITSQLSARTLSISNRLQSINSDAHFVQDVAVAYPECAVLANERCGGWYVEEGLKGTSFARSGKDSASGIPGSGGSGSAPAETRHDTATRGSVYFKSTDGHTGVWNFSLRRLNLHVLDVLGEFGGAIIVDSTRRGKHISDALSKTIPIWCAVVNRLLFPEAGYSAYHHIARLPEWISESEHAQMEDRLDLFVENARTLDLPLDALRSALNFKPIRPAFIARSLNLHPLPPQASSTQLSLESLPYHPIYLTMASQYQATSYDEANTGYVQGAGDDNEMWSQGLTSRMWWQHREELLAAGEEEVREVIDRIVASKTRATRAANFVGVEVTKGKLSLGGLPVDEGLLVEVDQNGKQEAGDVALIVCCATAEEMDDYVTEELRKSLGKRMLWLACGTGKAGSKALRKQLLGLADFVSGMVSPDGKDRADDVAARDTAAARGQDQANHALLSSQKDLHVLIADTESGKDIAVGVALALLALYSDEHGHIDWTTQTQDGLDKVMLRKKLSWITSSMPSANPSRATLNAVNECLFRR